MNWKKTAVITAGAAAACFSVGCFIGYYNTVPEKAAEKTYTGEMSIAPSPQPSDTAEPVGAEIGQTEAGEVYCILANDTGLYMYKISEIGSELVASDTNVVISLLPGSDRYRLSNGIECQTEEEAWSVWECFTS